MRLEFAEEFGEAFSSDDALRIARGFDPEERTTRCMRFLVESLGYEGKGERRESPMIGGTPALRSVGVERREKADPEALVPAREGLASSTPVA